MNEPLRQPTMDLKRTLIETMIQLLEDEPETAALIIQDAFRIAAGQALTPRKPKDAA